MGGGYGNCLALLMGHQRKPRFPMLSMRTESSVWPCSVSSPWPQGFSGIGNIYSWVSILTSHFLPKVMSTVNRL